MTKEQNSHSNRMTDEEILIQHKGEIKLMFLQFLKERDLMEKYKRSIMPYIPKQKLGDVMNPLGCGKLRDMAECANGTLSYKIYFTQLVNHAFCWADTQEGHKFWSNINDKWVLEVSRFIDNHRNNGKCK